MATVCWHDGADRPLDSGYGSYPWCLSCMYQQRTDDGVDQLDVVEYKHHKQQLCSGQSWGD